MLSVVEKALRLVELLVNVNTVGSVCRSVQVSACLSVSVSVCLSLSHTHARTQARTHARTHTHTHTHTRTHTQTHIHTHTYSLFLSLSPENVFLIRDCLQLIFIIFITRTLDCFHAGGLGLEAHSTSIVFKKRLKKEEKRANIQAASETLLESARADSLCSHVILHE